MLRNYTNFINENVDQVLNNVFRDCKPIIDEIKKCGEIKFLYRGMDIKNLDIKRFTSLEKRTPLDTNEYIHDKLNELFKEKFGWNVRDGVFAYFQEPRVNRFIHDEYKWNNKTMYGTNTYIMFPIGEYKYCWSPKVDDLYGEFEPQMSGSFMDDDELSFMYEDYTKEYTWEEWVEMHREYQEEGFFIKMSNIIDEEYIDNNLITDTANEVSFKCKEYYLVDQKFTQQLIDLIYK